MLKISIIVVYCTLISSWMAFGRNPILTNRIGIAFYLNSHKHIGHYNLLIVPH